jgi:hypothetical protein
MAQAWRECWLLGIQPAAATLPFAYADELLRECLSGALEAEFRLFSFQMPRLASDLKQAAHGDASAQLRIVEAVAAALVHEPSVALA